MSFHHVKMQQMYMGDIIVFKINSKQQIRIIQAMIVVQTTKIYFPG